MKVTFGFQESNSPEKPSRPTKLAPDSLHGAQKSKKLAVVDNFRESIGLQKSGCR
jgi:hypothetical protein